MRGGYDCHLEDCGIARTPMRRSTAWFTGNPSQLVCPYDASILTTPCSAAKMR